MTSLPLITPAPPCDKCWGCCCTTSREVLLELSDAEAPKFEHAERVPSPLPSEGDIWGIRPKANGRCPYLSGDNKCSIYEQRPQVCRTYNCIHGVAPELEHCSFLMKDNPNLLAMVSYHCREYLEKKHARKSRKR